MAQIFDDVFRTILEKMPELALPVINDVFHTSYTDEEQILQRRNEHMEASGRRETDSYLQIRDKLYHLECQSTEDSRISVRMIEYDFAIALEDATRGEGCYEMEFPRSALLYLRHTGHTPDAERVRLRMPDGQTVTYAVPVVKVQDYSEEMIFQKKLLFFLPFYILRYEDRIGEIAESPEETRRLAEEYERLRERMREELSGKDKADCYVRLAELVKRITDYVLREKEEVRERVGEVMGGQVIETEADRLLERGREEGLLDARREFIRKLLADHVPEVQILQYTGCTREDVEQVRRE